MNSLTGVSGFDKEAFEKVHASGEQITSIRFKIFEPWAVAEGSPIPWTQVGFYLNSRPSFTFDPNFHAGLYYVQEASSMFLEQVFRQVIGNRTLKVLDLCAAPGGKSTHIQSMLSKRDSLLVSNEVIKSRANILKDNIIKWGSSNVMVTNNDPKDFAKLEGYFDVIVVDAPCSGSGLFRREPEAIEEWSENNVQLCSQRQQRILADVWPALKENGILVYSTCSYSKEEDEDIVNWLSEEFQISNLKLEIDPSWGIVESGGGYRFWPDKVKGEGFFIACFKKTGEANEVAVKAKHKIDLATKKEAELISQWIQPDGLVFVKHQQTVYAWPEKIYGDFNWLLQQLKVVYSGVKVGELVRDKLIPDHALATSGRVNTSVPRVELSYERAIQYLQRKELQPDMPGKGWQLVTYGGHPLGWINVLANRVNNYYPKEMRILKDN